MLTGLPPFYDKDIKETYRKMQFDALRLTTLLPLSAQDILKKLLCRDQEHPFGETGISGIKAHPFFQPIDWQKLFKREYEPPFRLGEVAIAYTQREPQPSPSTTARLESLSSFFTSLALKLPRAPPGKTLDDPTAEWYPSAFKNAKSLPTESTTTNASLDEDGLTEEIAGVALSSADNQTTAVLKQWVLLWDEAAQSFVFHSTLTNTRKRVNPSRENFRPAGISLAQRAILARLPKENRPSMSETQELPSQSQMQNALEAILLAGHNHMNPQLLKYGIDLNIQVFEACQTPLDWAIDREDIDLVKPFLDHNAEPNFTFRTNYAGRY